jgi:hypothetical protein
MSGIIPQSSVVLAEAGKERATRELCKPFRHLRSLPPEKDLSPSEGEPSVFPLFPFQDLDGSRQASLP